MIPPLHVPTAMLLGAFGLTFQVVLLREFLGVFGSNELVIGLVMASWLLWSGLGSWLPNLRRNFPWLVGLLMLAAWLGPLTQISVALFPRLLGLPPGVVPGPAELFAAVALLPAPACMVQGACFVALARSLPEPDGAASRIYLYEAWGAVLGGLLTLVVFDSSVLLVATGVPLAFMACGFVRGGWRVAAAFVVPALGLLLWLPISSVFLEKVVWQGYDISDRLETPYGKTVAISKASETSLFVNGRLHTSTDDRSKAEAEFLPLLLSRFPRVDDPVLLVLGGSVARAAYIVKTMGDRLPRVVQILRDERLAQLEISTFLPDELPDGLRLDFREPLEAMRDICRPPAECMGLLNLQEGAGTFASARSSTRRFLEDARFNGRKHTGVRAVFLPLGEAGNYVPPWREEHAASVGGTMAAARGEAVRVVTAGSLLALSDAGMFPEDRKEIQTRLNALPAEFRSLSDPALVSRFELVDIITDSSPAGLIVTVDHPTPVVYALADWVAQFSPSLVPKSFFSPQDRILMFVAAGCTFVLLVLLPLVVSRRFSAAFPWLFLSGFAGVALELALILAYQVRYGELYRQVGILLALFMAGMALGTAWAKCATARANLLRFGLALPGISALAVAAILHCDVGFPGFALLLALVGGISGALFAWGVKEAREFGGNAIVWANGIDHLGATLAAGLVPCGMLFLGVEATLGFLAIGSFVSIVASGGH